MHSPWSSALLCAQGGWFCFRVTRSTDRGHHQEIRGWVYVSIRAPGNSQNFSTVNTCHPISKTIDSLEKWKETLYAKLLAKACHKWWVRDVTHVQIQNKQTVFEQGPQLGKKLTEIMPPKRRQQCQVSVREWNIWFTAIPQPLQVFVHFLFSILQTLLCQNSRKKILSWRVVRAK